MPTPCQHFFGTSPFFAPRLFFFLFATRTQGSALIHSSYKPRRAAFAKKLSPRRDGDSSRLQSRSQTFVNSQRSRLCIRQFIPLFDFCQSFSVTRPPPVRCLTATPCTIEPRPSRTLRFGRLCCGYWFRRICRALLRCVVCVLQSSNLLPTFFALRICRSSNTALNFPPAQIHGATLRSRPIPSFRLECKTARKSLFHSLARKPRLVIFPSPHVHQYSFSRVPICFAITPILPFL